LGQITSEALSLSDVLSREATRHVPAFGKRPAWLTLAVLVPGADLVLAADAWMIVDFTSR
jgi:di/tricarboxylate transporter